MTTIALVLLAVYFALAVVLRLWMQYRRTGDAGFRGISGAPGSVEWWAGVLFALSILALGAAPVAAVLGLKPVDALVHPAGQWVGVVVAILGIAATAAAQFSMGASWRIGVDADERTDLVTDGVFGLVRNPIYTAMIVATLGLMLVVPNVVAVAALLLLILSLEVQVRVVEEPYLARLHGAAWDAYVARVGRFIPTTGRTLQQRRPAPR